MALTYYWQTSTPDSLAVVPVLWWSTASAVHTQLLLRSRNDCACRKRWPYILPRDIPALLPRGMGLLCPLSPSAQTSTSLIPTVKTPEKFSWCHNPWSHKTHRRSCPCAHFCDTKHKLTSRSLYQIRDLSEEILCTLPVLIQAKSKFLEATNSVRGLPNLNPADEQQPTQTARSFQEPQREHTMVILSLEKISAFCPAGKVERRVLYIKQIKYSREEKDGVWAWWGERRRGFGGRTVERMRLRRGKQGIREAVQKEAELQKGFISKHRYSLRKQIAL